MQLKNLIFILPFLFIFPSLFGQTETPEEKKLKEEICACMDPFFESTPLEEIKIKVDSCMRLGFEKHSVEGIDYMTFKSRISMRATNDCEWSLKLMERVMAEEKAKSQLERTSCSTKKKPSGSWKSIVKKGAETAIVLIDFGDGTFTETTDGITLVYEMEWIDNCFAHLKLKMTNARELKALVGVLETNIEITHLKKRKMTLLSGLAKAAKKLLIRKLENKMPRILVQSQK